MDPIRAKAIIYTRKEAKDPKETDKGRDQKLYERVHYM